MYDSLSQSVSHNSERNHRVAQFYCFVIGTNYRKWGIDDKKDEETEKSN